MLSNESVFWRSEVCRRSSPDCRIRNYQNPTFWGIPQIAWFCATCKPAIWGTGLTSRTISALIPQIVGNHFTLDHTIWGIPVKSYNLGKSLYLYDLKFFDGVPQIVGSVTTKIQQSGEFPRLHDGKPCRNLQSGEYSKIFKMLQSGEAWNLKKNDILHFVELLKK